jgi:hypothetical protein
MAELALDRPFLTTREAFILGASTAIGPVHRVQPMVR